MLRQRQQLPILVAQACAAVYAALASTISLGQRGHDVARAVAVEVVRRIGNANQDPWGRPDKAAELLVAAAVKTP